MSLLFVSCSGPPIASTHPPDSFPQPGAPLNLAGDPVDPFAGSELEAIVLLFVSTDCPISQQYAPQMNRLWDQFTPRGIKFWFVYPNADESPEVIARHLSDFHLGKDALRDPAHILVKSAEVQVTPEAAVFNRRGALIYHGRLDDLYISVGQKRFRATERSLENVLTAIIAGRPPRYSTRPAVGCYISPLP